MMKSRIAIIGIALTTMAIIACSGNSDNGTKGAKLGASTDELKLSGDKTVYGLSLIHI